VGEVQEMGDAREGNARVEKGGAYSISTVYGAYTDDSPRHRDTYNIRNYNLANLISSERQRMRLSFIL
jgi:hypothetical protein